MPIENPTSLSFQRPSVETSNSLNSAASARASSSPSAALRSSINESAAVREMLDEVMEPAPFRRDFNLIRAVLLEAEQPGIHPFTYPTYDRTMVQSHLVLLIEAGFAHGTIVRNANGLTTASIDRLTWFGHDLVALLKDAALWQQARNTILDSHGCAHTDLLIEWLKTQKRTVRSA